MPAVLASQTITWYHFSKEKGRYEILFRPEKYIETSEHGLVIIGVTEADAGRYDCHMGASLLCSYNVTVDAHRCAPPAKSNDYQKIYSDWCHEFEKYKSAMKTWERKQAVCNVFCALHTQNSRKSMNPKLSVLFDRKYYLIHTNLILILKFNVKTCIKLALEMKVKA